MFRHFILFLLLKSANGQHNEKQYRDSSCSSPLCSCCLDTVQCSESGNCGAQCMDGYFGKKCQTTCPDNCVRCRDPDNFTYDSSLWGVANCTECKDGYYSTADFFQCQFNCTYGCQTCISDTQCTSCKADYVLFNDQCLTCKTGCASCTSYNACSVCQDGYHNSGGDAGDLNCVECSTGCRNQCDKTTGTCTCKAGYTGSRCESCDGGWYLSGASCRQCQSICATCSTTAYTCTSCLTGYFSDGNNCNPCKAGCTQCSSNTNCHKCATGHHSPSIGCPACSTGCEGRCDQTFGHCRCKPGFDGEKCDRCSPNVQSFPKCDQCITGYQGEACDQNCPENCKQTLCERYGAKCTDGCKGKFFGSNCNKEETCIAGLYGDECSLTCPRNCLRDCDRINGACFSCIIGYHGDECSLRCPSKCFRDCDRINGACFSCINGYHGNECSLICPNNCFRDCDRMNGTCYSCINGYHGDDCSLRCPNNCFRDCDRINGTCDSCINGYHGDDCSLRCPSNCIRDCDRINGSCYACINGYNGDDCTIRGSEGLSFAAGVALGIGVAAVVVLVIAVILLVYRRRLNARQLTGDPSNQRNPVHVNDDVTSPATITVGDDDKNIQVHKKNTKQKDKLSNIQNKDDELGEGALQA